MGIKRKQIDSWCNEGTLQTALSATGLPVLLPPYLSQKTFPNEHSMQKLATGLQKMNPSITIGGRAHLLRDLETLHDSSHPFCPLFAIGSGWRRGIAYMVLYYNKH